VKNKALGWPRHFLYCFVTNNTFRKIGAPARQAWSAVASEIQLIA
jgi:hypothetical protein